MHITKTSYTKQEAAEFLQKCDGEFDRKIELAMSLILEKQNRFLCLAGPSCAGKTTTAKKITQKLSEYGVTTHVISIDDFFFDMDYLLAMAEKNNGRLDMDSIAALDLNTFSACLKEIIETNSTQLPVFDFHTDRKSVV